MVSRRAAITTVATLLQGQGASAKASQPATPVNFDVPAHACDCHTHIFGDPKTFPYSPNRRYTPETALPTEMEALHRKLHVERVVIVTPSVYGTDNSATLYGMKSRGATARGIAVIDEQTSDRDLSAMARSGVRGIRLNLTTAGVTDPAVGRQRLQRGAVRMKALGWHIQIFTSLDVISAIKDAVLDCPVPVVFDHFGGAEASRGIAQHGFSDLLDLLKSGKAYVKISAAYRASNLGPGYRDVAPLANALIAVNPDRVIWGTDWPHPNAAPLVGSVAPFFQIDDGRLLNELAAWSPNKETLAKILVDNPAKLYGF
jgi:predicted TIM-barrel fold metal-dependent hydrolase